MSLVSSFFSLFIPSPPVPGSLAQWAGGARDPYRIVHPLELLQDKQIAHHVDEIRVALGEGEKIFRRDLLPLIERTAAWAQLLPASQINHHQTPGGLLIHLLDVAVLVLNATKDFTPFKPNFIEVHDRDLPELRHYGRLLMVLLALTHDFGKISTNMDIIFLGQPTDAPPYNPHRSGLFTLSLYDHARELYGPDVDKAQYRIAYRSVDPNRHAADSFPAATALLAESGVRIESRLALDLFLRDHKYANTEVNFYRSKIKPFIMEADARSTEDNIKADPPDRPKIVSGSIAHCFYFWARKLVLTDLPLVDKCLFLPLGRVPALLQSLPDHEEYKGITNNPLSPQVFMMEVKGAGFATKHDVRSERYFLHIHDETVGLFLSEEFTNNLLYLQGLGLSESKLALDSSLSSHETELSSEERPEQPDSGPNFAAAATELNQSQSTDMSIDISGLGVAVAPPPNDAGFPEERSLDHYDEISSIESNAPLLSHPGLPDLVVAFATKIERLDLEKLLEEGTNVELNDGCLHFSKTFTAAMISELQKSRRLTESQLRELCEQHAADLWSFKGQPNIEGFACTSAYTSELLTLGSASELLICHRQATISSDAAVDHESGPVQPPPVPTHPSQDRSSNPKPEPAHSIDKKILSSDGFVSEVCSDYKNNPNTVITLNGQLLDVPIAVVDSYLDNQKHRRAALIHILEKTKVLVSRTSDSYVLDHSNEAFARCSNE